METNRIRTILVGLSAVCLIAVFGLSPVSAALQVATVTPSREKTATSAPVTATKTTVVSAITATVKSTIPAATATKVVTAPVATATKTAPVTIAAKTVPATTATKVITLPVATATKTITPAKVVTPTATVAATKTVTRTATVTRTPTKTPTVAARAPRAGTVSSLSTAFVVQNTDPSVAANISATFYDTNGAVVGSPVTNSALDPNRSWTVDQRTQAGLGTSFTGSVVVSSTTQLASVVNEYGGSSALGQDFRMDSYPGTSSGAAAASILLPQVVKNFVSYNSTIAIQNTSSSVDANVTITYTNILSNPVGTIVHNNIVIHPGASAMIDLANEAPGIASIFGPAQITSNQNVAVIVNRNKAGALITYGGFTNADAGNTLIVTQALTNFGSLVWGTAIEGMTADGNSSSYSVTYTNLLNGSQKTCSLPDGATFRIDFRVGGWPPACTPPVDSNTQFFGQVVIVGSRPLVALVNQIAGNTTNGTRTTTVPAFSSTGGTTTGFAPLVMNAYLDSGTNITWGTAIEGRMAGTGTVHIDYYLSNGQTYSDNYTVGADQIFRFDQRTSNPLPAGSIAAAKITAPFSILFKVNLTGDASASGDAYGTYKGINQ